MRRLLSRMAAATMLALVGCHTCDVCDDCGDGAGCGSNGYHARNYGDQGFAPGYATPVVEGATVTSKAKRIPMQTLPTKAKPAVAAKSAPERMVR